MATLSINNLARAVYESSKGKEGKTLDDFIVDVVNFLKEKRLLSKKDAFLSALERIIDKEEKITRAKISTKDKPKDELKKRLEEFIKERYKVKDVILTFKENPELLGGIKVEIGDEVMDVTLRNKLNKLQDYLIKN